MAAEPPVLFDFIGPPPIHGDRLQAAIGWLARKRRHFSFFVFLSLMAHLAVFGMVILLRPQAKTPASPVAVRARDFQAFKDALEEYASDGQTPERLANALMALTENEVEEAFRQAPVLDYRLTDREKAGLYKTMLGQAMSEFMEGRGEGPSALDLPLSRYFGGLREMPIEVPGEEYRLVRIEDPLEESARLYRLSKERAEAIESLGRPGDEAGSRAAEVNLVNVEGRLLTVPGEYFYRESPYLQIAAAGSSLFYVIKGFPELSAAKAGNGPGPAESESAREDRPAAAPTRPASPAFAVILMPKGATSGGISAPSAAKPPLALAKKEIDRVLDGLMALPVVEQVRTFHRDYLEAYDPDSGDLARLAGEFLYRNLGMVFVQTGDRLSRGFDLLEEIYYDNLSMGGLVAFAQEHPRSKTGAEILLGLAASYEFERRSIVALDGSLDAAKTVLMDPANERSYVHNKNVKAYVVREVYLDLAAELRDRGYPALETVIQKYRDEQVRIYDLLIAMGGAIRGRALYALGRLYWDEGRTELAMETWKSADPAFADGTLTAIRGTIIEGRRLNDPVRRIDAILGQQAAAEKSDQLARIAKFHKWDRR
ncbi:MAG TPA: hypothetical protein VLJ16_11680 [Acidobacteriota bacterium]|nr:hypothetical protein [Acidobacteriota bacterium]